jgi:electron transport complex protein RnfE
VSALRNFIPYEIRIPVFILIIAALTTVVDLSFNAFFHDLYLVLGIFIPLIVTNCIVLARVEAYAAKNDPLTSTVDGIMMGIGLVWVLAVLGGMRELLGAGTLFSGIEMILPGASAWNVFGDDYPGFLIAILPPGAFFALGVLIAVQRHQRAPGGARARNPPPAPTRRRAEDSRPPSRPPRADDPHGCDEARGDPRVLPPPARQANPNPQTELEYASPYQLLVAVVLSAQATDRSVNLATRKLFATPPRPRRWSRSARKASPTTSRPSACSATRRRTRSRCRACCSSATAARCRRARGARGPARRRPQDRQRGAQHRLPPADDGGGHPHLPARQPHRARPRQRTCCEVELEPTTGCCCTARKPRCAECGGAQAEPRATLAPHPPPRARRPPLADPARPLRGDHAPARRRDLRRRAAQARRAGDLIAAASRPVPPAVPPVTPPRLALHTGEALE